MRLISALVVLALAACAAPGGPPADAPRTVAARAVSDQRLGDETHPKLLTAHGGAIRNTALADYVDGIGQRIARQSEQPDGPWIFTVLDSPQINAFALPGGYVYVTRGLIALASDEAELAAVIAHEIGHVTAEHTRNRQETAAVAQIGVLGATILGAVAGLDSASLRAIGRLGSAAGQGYVAGYSRSQEYEADLLGVRYLARAGYDPAAEADFLIAMQSAQALERRITGAGDPSGHFLSTHPATPARARQAAAAARAEGLTARQRARDRFLDRIDGMVWGDSLAQGVVEGRRFLHPEFGVTFTAPRGFTLANSPARVVAKGPEGAVILFDADRSRVDPEKYIDEIWSPALTHRARRGPVQYMRRFHVDGFPAAAAEMAISTDQGRRIVRMAAVRSGEKMYRFLGLHGEYDLALGRRMDQAAMSFRRLTKAERGDIRPWRIEVHTVRRGDTLAALARRAEGLDHAAERLRVLNGLAPGENLTPGRRVKLISR